MSAETLGTILMVVSIVATVLGAVKTYLEIRQMLKTTKNKRTKRRKPHAPSARIGRSR